MLGGTILSYEEFKTILSKALENTDYEKQIVLCLKRIKDNANNVNRVFQEIEFLETKLFNNPVTSLMIVANLSMGAQKFKQSQEAQEKLKPNTKGRINYDSIEKAAINQQITQAVSTHLNNLINYVNNTPVPNSFSANFFHNNEIDINSDTKKRIGTRLSDPNYTGVKTYAYIFYGNKDKTVPGTVADGFLNHLGNMHHTIFDTKKHTLKTYNFKNEVQIEEGEIGLYKLLSASFNPIGQQTGGDLILLSGNEIIANIQLKSMLVADKNASQSINITDIINATNRMLDFVEKGKFYNKDVIIDIFYDLFATSGIQQDIEKTIKQSAIDYAKAKLKEVSKYKSGDKILITFT